MIKDITIFNAATGEVLCTTTTDVAPQLDAGEEWIAGRWPDSEWRIDPDTLHPLPLREFAPAVSLNRIAGLPAGTIAHIDGERFTVDDGALDFDPELGLPSAVHVMLFKPTYRPWRGDVPCG